MTEHLDRRYFLAAATGLVATACASTKPKGTDATTATTGVATTTPSATTSKFDPVANELHSIS
jgi:hypothetical protein